MSAAPPSFRWGMTPLDPALGTGEGCSSLSVQCPNDQFSRGPE